MLMAQINRRKFIQNFSLAALPLLGSWRVPADVLKFTLGFWQAPVLQRLFDKLLMPNVSLDVLEREGKVGLFTNGVVIGGKVEDRAATAMTYLKKRPLLLPVPLATNVDDLQNMQSTAQKEENKLGVISHFHLLQSASKVKEIIRHDLMGEIKQIDLLVNDSDPEDMVTAGADGLLGWYFHPLYLTTLFLKSNPVSLQARKYDGQKAFTNIYFDFEYGTKVNLSVKDDLSREHWVINIRGEKATCRLDGNHKISFKDQNGKTNLFSFDSNDYKFTLEATVLNFVKAVQDELEIEHANELSFLSVAWHQALAQSLTNEARVSIPKMVSEE